jgi:hypothetical protein
MGYSEAMETAGATVHEFKEFGSYQGTWLALVTYNGNTGWIEDSYGSCSGCDAFEAEGFDYKEPVVGEKNWLRDEPYTQADVDAYREKLAAFGRDYLERNFATLEEKLEEYRAKVAKEYAWDDDKEILAYLEARISTVN